MKSISVPDVSKINFHPIKSSANFDKATAKLIEKFPLVDIPFKFQLDDIHTNFVKVRNFRLHCHLISEILLINIF